MNSIDSGATSPPYRAMTLGQTLTTPPPRLPVEIARALLRRHWGRDGELTALTSERDLNFRVEGTQPAVLKLANPAEPAGVTEFQTLALLHISNSGLPVPQVIPTSVGDLIVETEHGRLRLLTYLQGLPLHAAPRSDAQRAAVGAMAARLTRALQDFRHPAEVQDLQWDIRHTARLRPLLPNIPEGLRALAQAVLDDFETQALPLLPELRWQVVHNDLNPHNLLVDSGDPDRLAGILDFGDMVRTPLVCDMGVAASYQVDPTRPLASLRAFAQGYDAIHPLTEAERAVFPLMTRARMLTTLAIAHTRALRYPENAPYILRNTPSASQGLVALQTDLADLWSR